MSAEVKVTGQNQEQFLLLAKSAKGAALATLIHQVLEAPGVYVFGELLDMPNVREDFSVKPWLSWIRFVDQPDLELTESHLPLLPECWD